MEKNRQRFIDKEEYKMSIVARQFQSAIKKGQEGTEKHIQTMVERQDMIIERLNWVMKSQQKIADHLKIKLDDPLEFDKEE